MKARSITLRSIQNSICATTDDVLYPNEHTKVDHVIEALVRSVIVDNYTMDIHVSKDDEVLIFSVYTKIGTGKGDFDKCKTVVTYDFDTNEYHVDIELFFDEELLLRNLSL
jgi:hypothetical protein